MPDRFKKYRIASARLQGYDYGQNGAYFVTICTKDRLQYFGNIVVGNVETQYFASPPQNFAEAQNFAPGNKETHYYASLRASQIGEIAIDFWKKIPEHFPFVVLDEFQIMPNHLHGIIIINKMLVENKSEPGMQNELLLETQNELLPETQNELLPETQIIASLHEGYKNKFGPQSGNLSSILRGYKAGVKSFATTNNIEFGWQSRFHDHIIRDKNEMNRIRKYIIDNPDNWVKHRDNVEGLFM